MNDFTIENDELIRSTQVSNDIYENEVIITKEQFIECFNEWIKPELDKMFVR